ncbi:MAG: glycosyltransferase family 4 protein [Rhodospirillaceae bacterium]
MKILYHHRTLSKDGQNVHIEELIGAFRRLGHDIRIVGPTAHKNAAFGSDGGLASKVRAALPASLGELVELAYSMLAFYRLLKAYRAFRPDVLYERYNLFLLSGAWLHRLTGVPYFLEVNAPLADERRDNSGLSLYRLAKWCERHVWRAADLVLPVTKVLAGYVTAAGVRARRIEVLPNGIDPKHFPRTQSGEAIRRAHGLEGKTVIGFTGFLREWHGLPAIVEVMRELTQQGHDLHFLVVGEGQGRAALERAAEQAGIASRITITGVVDRHQIPAYVAAFDIAVQPKATEYASPLKLFEYMALARAIIAPDQPNLREVLTNGENALLFAPDDPKSLAAVLSRLIREPVLRDQLGANAARTVAQLDLTWDGNARKIAAAMETAVARERRPSARAAAILEEPTRPA